MQILQFPWPRPVEKTSSWPLYPCLRDGVHTSLFFPSSLLHFLLQLQYSYYPASAPSLRHSLFSVEAMDAFTPQQTIELVSRIGCKKTHMRWDKLFWNSFITGPLLGFGYVKDSHLNCILLAMSALQSKPHIVVHMTAR